MKNIVILLIAILISLLIGGGYGYYLADERIGGFVHRNGVKTSLFYHHKFSEIITDLENNELNSAIVKLKRMQDAEQVTLDGCLYYDECSKEIKDEIKAYIKP